MRRRRLFVVGAAAVFALAMGAVAAASLESRPVHPVHPVQPRRAPIVILISLDAFRWDYLQRPATVNLRALAARGVHTERLVPAFPSKTYPNHYSLVTGLYAEHHGIVANNIVDPILGKFATGNDPAAHDGRWYGGEPIWVTAERQGVRTAPFMWPGGDTEIGGVRAMYAFPYDATVSRAARVDTALALLALTGERAPRFMTLYFEDVDNASHAVGPAGARTDSAIAKVDSVIGALVAGIERLRLTDVVNVVVVSDHGMAPTAPQRTIFLDDYVAMDSVVMVDWSPVAAIAPKPGNLAYVYAKLKNANPHLTVYRKDEIPARFHFKANARITPIVAIAEEGWSITTHKAFATADTVGNRGAHGYDNALLSMGAILVGAGPGLRRGVTVPPLQNVHVYPLLAALLGITPARVDGSLDSVRALLRPTRTRASSFP